MKEKNILKWNEFLHGKTKIQGVESFNFEIGEKRNI